MTKGFWEWETEAFWDTNKEYIIGTRADAFNMPKGRDIGISLPGEWGILKNEDDEIIGYGWIELYDDKQAEISIAIKDASQVKGFGKQILEELVKELKARGYASVIAIVKRTNICSKEVIEWLCGNGFSKTKFGVELSAGLVSGLFKKEQDLNLVKELK